MTMFHFQSIPKFDHANDVVPCSELENDQLHDLARTTRENVAVDDDAHG